MTQLIRRASTLFPVALLLLAMVSIQAGAAIAKTMFPIVGPIGMVTVRITLGTIVLVCALRPWRTRITSTSWRPLLVYGISLGTMNTLYYLALNRVPLGITVALEFTGPLAVAVFASRRPLDFCWILLVGAGLTLLLPIGRFHAGIDPIGALLALSAGACWALYIIFGQRAGAGHGAQTAALGSIISAIVVIPIGLVTARPALFSHSILLPGLAVAVLSQPPLPLYARDDRTHETTRQNLRRSDEPGARIGSRLRIHLSGRTLDDGSVDRTLIHHPGVHWGSRHG